MEMAFGVLGFTPKTFWSMTMEEFSTACDGRIKSMGGEEEDPIGREDLERMMERFPDDIR